MDFIDKNGRLRGTGPINLELGCGAYRQFPGAVSVDALDFPSVDVVGEVTQVLRALTRDRVCAVKSWHFLEHVEDIPALLEELARVVRPGGTVEFTVPHFSNPYFYSDPTHRAFFGLYTFNYLAESSLFKRVVPNYQKHPAFRLTRVDLRFRGDTFRYRGLVKRAIGSLINRFTALSEFYEENLVWVFPCYELTYLLVRLPTPESGEPIR